MNPRIFCRNTDVLTRSGSVNDHYHLSCLFFRCVFCALYYVGYNLFPFHNQAYASRHCKCVNLRAICFASANVGVKRFWQMYGAVRGGHGGHDCTVPDAHFLECNRFWVDDKRDLQSVVKRACEMFYGSNARHVCFCQRVPLVDAVVVDQPLYGHCVLCEWHARCSILCKRCVYSVRGGRVRRVHDSLFYVRGDETFVSGDDFGYLTLVSANW